MEEKNIKLNICYGCMSPLEEGTTICPECGYICTRKHNPQDTLPEGTVLFRKYLVGKVLGRGGFGITYLGYDLDLQIRVAIKEFFPMGLSTRSSEDYSVLPATTGEDEAFSRGCAAFLEEARTLAAFKNRYVVHVRDYFREHGTAYLVMDYVEGKTLSAEINEYGGRIPADRLLGLMKPLILQLDKLHKKNIIHRDIAPDNLIIVNDEELDGEEHFVLLDFGAARSFVSSKISQKYTATVKNGYAPIEQYSQKSKQGPYTDVYALCATIYAALTGVVPPSALERSADGAQIEPLSKYCVNLPEYVEQAILHGLAQNGEDRTQTMRQLYDELTTVPDARQQKYAKAVAMIGVAVSESDYQKAEKAFAELGEYKDSSQQAAKCRAKADESHKKNLYAEAKELMAENTLSGFEKAAKKFAELNDFQDSKQQLDYCTLKMDALRGRGKKKSSVLPVILAILLVAAIGAGLFAWKRAEETTEQSRLQQEAASAAVQQAEEALKETQEKLQESEKARAEAENEAQEKTKEAEEAKASAEAAEKAMTEAQAEAENAKAAADAAEEAMRKAQSEAEARAEEVAKARADAEARTAEAEKAKAEAEEAVKSAEEARAAAEAAEKRATETEQTAGASAKEAEDALREARAAAEAAEQKAAEAEALAQARAEEAEQAKAEAENAARSAEEAKAAATAAEQRASEATSARTAAEQKAAEATDARTAAEQKAEEATAAQQAAEQRATEATEAQRAAEEKAAAEAEERRIAEEKEAAYYSAISLFNKGDFEAAKKAFQALGDYQDSVDYVTKCDAAIAAIEAEAKATPAPTPAPTVDPTPTPIPTIAPTAKPTTVPAAEPAIGRSEEELLLSETFATAAKGDIVSFGHYEQDNNEANGEEPIEWIVLDVRDGKALIVSKYALDKRPFESNKSTVTWNNCSLRNWLNKSFLLSAFSADERDLIVRSSVEMDPNLKYGTNSGSATEDEIFLLSIQEAEKYFETDESRICQATELARNRFYFNQHPAIDENGNCWWWLRTSGGGNGFASGVTEQGIIHNSGNNIRENGVFVRPAMWVNQEIVRTPTIAFGSYEQDNDTSNGAEPIEWLVLDEADGKMLLLSKNGLDARQYHNRKDRVTWETSDIRAWLNETFLNAAFSEADQERINLTKVTADKTQPYNADAGRDTEDKVFLLSRREANKYLLADAMRLCRATPYAIAQGVSESKLEDCRWWLRSPGVNSSCASYVGDDGDVYFGGRSVETSGFAIRPAIWVSVNSLVLSGKEEESPSGETGSESSTTPVVELPNYDSVKPVTIVNEKIVSASEGDYVLFGKFEQDGNLSNGAEAIEWKILARENGTALLISRFALESMPFESSMGSAKWETSSLRRWLNNEFYNRVFNDEEKQFIEKSAVSAEPNPKYGINSGKDTNDFLFLLSASETQTYFSSAGEMTCKATTYARQHGGQNARVDDKGNCWWWLRTAGNGNSFAMGVTEQGLVHNSGDDIRDVRVFVRPTMRIAESVLHSSEVSFGHYEQDNNPDNGAEPIDWIVLDAQDNKILLLSKMGLDAQKFNSARKHTTWETCSLRDWLNNDFYLAAFTEDEQSKICLTTVHADRNPKFDMDPGNGTEDRVFLLSVPEVEKYLLTGFQRQCEATEYAKEQCLASARANGKRTVSDELKWMLRSPGVNQFCTASVGVDGSINYAGDEVGYGAFIVRPAIWVSLDAVQN